jgi:hypothetical protein
MFKNKAEIIKLLIEGFPDRNISDEDLDEIDRFVVLYREAYRYFNTGDIVKPIKYNLLKEITKVYLNERAMGSDIEKSMLLAKKHFLNTFTIAENRYYWDVKFRSILGY